MPSVWVLRVVNDILPTEAVWVLTAGVRMIPIRSRLLYGEVVREGRAWGNTALRHAVRAVHFVCAVLEQSMEVDAGAFVAELDRLDKNILLECA